MTIRTLVRYTNGKKGLLHREIVVIEHTDAASDNRNYVVSIRRPPWDEVAAQAIFQCSSFSSDQYSEDQEREARVLARQWARAFSAWEVSES